MRPEMFRMLCQQHDQQFDTIVVLKNWHVAVALDIVGLIRTVVIVNRVGFWIIIILAVNLHRSDRMKIQNLKFFHRPIRFWIRGYGVKHQVSINIFFPLSIYVSVRNCFMQNKYSYFVYLRRAWEAFMHQIIAIGATGSILTSCRSFFISCSLEKANFYLSSFLDCIGTVSKGSDTI